MTMVNVTNTGAKIIKTMVITANTVVKMTNTMVKEIKTMVVTPNAMVEGPITMVNEANTMVKIDRRYKLKYSNNLNSVSDHGL